MTSVIYSLQFDLTIKKNNKNNYPKIIKMGLLLIKEGNIFYNTFFFSIGLKFLGATENITPELE